MAWLYLIAAGVVEVAMAASLKASSGWTKLVPSISGVILALLSIFLLTHALRLLPSGMAYAVWTGIGAIGVTVYGAVFYGETLSIPRLACIALVVAGVVGLRLTDSISGK